MAKFMHPAHSMLFTRVVHRVRYAAHGILLSLVVGLAWPIKATAVTVAKPTVVTAAWDGVADPNIAGYNLYYGTASRTYTNMLSTGMATSTSVSNLQAGTTYYFAATTVTIAGLESSYSTETAYAVPVQNHPPTLDPLNDISVSENSGSQTINLTGISSGAVNEVQTLTVTAYSSNPSLVPNPTVAYSSPAATGTLTFAPAANASGSATLTVMVDDGASLSNTIIRAFTVTVVPFNAPPTLSPLANLTINENTGVQTINLAGISTGATNEIQPLSVVAFSSNPSLIPNPTVSYTSPNATGILTFAPLTNTYGSANISVTVNDSQPLNNVVTQSFSVTVAQTFFPPTPVTNAIVRPNSTFQFAINSPFKKGDKWSCALSPAAPDQASIQTLNRAQTLVWTPSVADASTTNQIWIQLTDSTTPSLTTNELVVVIVQDYLNVALGVSRVQAGQGFSLPVSVETSDGVTNCSFTVNVSSNRFLSPTLSAVSSVVGASSLQNQGTNLLISFQAAPGQSLQGSNFLAQLNLQTAPVQSSAFVSLPVKVVSAIKPNGTAYTNSVATAGSVAVVGDVPLLQTPGANSSTVSLNLLGKVGNTYQLLSSSGTPGSSTWVPVLTYTQTNVSQLLVLPATNSMMIFRLLQK